MMELDLKCTRGQGYYSLLKINNFTIHGERTSPCRFCVDFERTGIKRWGFSERVRLNSGGLGTGQGK